MDAPYATGRTDQWLKFKCEAGQELVVVGWTDPEGSRVALGALLLAYHDTEPIGCVGLIPTPPPGTIEVKRLYVRPAHRRAGAARLLMHHAHSHANRHGFTRLVLDVMPTRTHVIDFYRRLGYTETKPYITAGPWSMIYMERHGNQ
jgi:ribosomal protein S18 acetylase RimI-like enzyme